MNQNPQSGSHERDIESEIKSNKETERETVRKRHKMTKIGRHIQYERQQERKKIHIFTCFF